MMTTEVRDELRTLFGQVMDVDPDEIEAGEPRDAMPAWTSLAHLMLISQIESRFDVTFTSAEIAAITSFGEVERALAQRLSGA